MNDSPNAPSGAEAITVTNIRASFGRTYDLGKFESIRVDLRMEAVILPGEDPTLAALALTQSCAAVANKMAAIEGVRNLQGDTHRGSIYRPMDYYTHPALLEAHATPAYIMAECTLLVYNPASRWYAAQLQDNDGVSYRAFFRDIGKLAPIGTPAVLSAKMQADGSLELPAPIMVTARLFNGKFYMVEELLPMPDLDTDTVLYAVD